MRTRLIVPLCSTKRGSCQTDKLTDSNTESPSAHTAAPSARYPPPIRHARRSAIRRARGSCRTPTRRTHRLGHTPIHPASAAHAAPQLAAHAAPAAGSSAAHPAEQFSAHPASDTLHPPRRLPCAALRNSPSTRLRPQAHPLRRSLSNSPRTPRPRRAEELPSGDLKHGTARARAPRTGLPRTGTRASTAARAAAPLFTSSRRSRACFCRTSRRRARHSPSCAVREGRARRPRFCH